MEIWRLMWHIWGMQKVDYEAATREVAEREFGNANFRAISAYRISDSDGDPIWRVVVVLDEPEKVPAGKISGFVRLLRSAMPDEPFPIVSFRSLRDEQESSPEAA